MGGSGCTCGHLTAAPTRGQAWRWEGWRRGGGPRRHGCGWLRVGLRECRFRRARNVEGAAVVTRQRVGNRDVVDLQRTPEHLVEVHNRLPQCHPGLQLVAL